MLRTAWSSGYMRIRIFCRASISILGILITLAPVQVLIRMCRFRWRWWRGVSCVAVPHIVVFIAGGVIVRIVSGTMVFVVVFGWVGARVRVPGLRMRCWRQRRHVIRIRVGIYAWDVVLVLVLVPVLVYAVPIIIIVR